METPQGRESVMDSQAPNPAKFFASWDSTNKQFSFWDKVNKVDIMLPLPFAFIPLYKMTTLKGYNHKEGKSYWSNEVKDLSTEKFIVKSKNLATKEIKTEFVGLYSEIKTLIDGRANYTESLYVGVKDNAGVLQLANLQISTSALKPWITFIKSNDISKIAVQVASFTNEKNGSVNFTSPVYSALPVTPKMDAEAGVLQKQVKEYIAGYLSAQAGKLESESTPVFKSPEPAYEPPVTSNSQFGSSGQSQFAANHHVPAGNVNDGRGAFGGETIQSNPFENDQPPF